MLKYVTYLVNDNSMSIITLDQQLKRLKINSHELDNQVVFEYFNKLPSEERDEKFTKALYIGVLALMEDRLSAFLSKTQNELGTELENLKMIFEMKKEIFYKTAVKGMAAEDDIADFLNQYFETKKLSDKAQTTGTQEGLLPKNKSGDILCFVEGDENKKIVMEIKFDKSIKLGDIEDKDIFTKNKQDTAWSQIIEAKANRGAKVGIMVFDVSLCDSSILKETDSVAFIQVVGFIAIVDSQKGNYSNLLIAYYLARDIILHAKQLDFDGNTLGILMKRLIKDITTFMDVKSLVEDSMKINQQILERLDKGLASIEFCEKYLQKFLGDGKLTDSDLLDFYNGSELREKFSLK